MKHPSKTKKINQNFGTIYRCLNTITGKSYIGQTRYKLEKRKLDHFNTTSKTRTKFGNALKKYDRDIWQWFILDEAPYRDLDLLEKKYIAEFDTYKNGYNSNTGQDQKTLAKIRTVFEANNNIYKFYSAKHSVVYSTMRDMVDNYDLSYAGVSQIVREERPRHKDWVMAEFKDNYDKILGLYDFWHPVHGYLKCSPAELTRKYNVSHSLINQITTGRSIRVKNWYLVENKHLFTRIYKE